MSENRSFQEEIKDLVAGDSVTEDALKAIAQGGQVEPDICGEAVWFLVSALTIGSKDAKKHYGGLDFFRITTPVDYPSALRLLCPECHQEGLVIVAHQKTGSSLIGDSWATRAYVLCPQESVLRLVVERLSYEYRF